MSNPVCAAKLLCLVCAGSASAVSAAGDSSGPDRSERLIEEVVIVAHPLSAEGLAQAHDVLEGAELDRKLASSLGETLSHQPGVQSSSFGQAAGRPVIHGLAGARVRVMEDRSDSLDVSVTSADHAVTVEPFIADRIEVLKGPSTLLYGSGAIGGAVDVHTGRIPHAVPDEAVTGRLEARRADNADRTIGALRLDGRAGDRFAWHADGFYRDADDYEIPGFVESRRQRALEAAEEHEEEHEEEAEARGKLPGSHYRIRGGAAGVSYVGERGFAGLALSLLDSRYGLPGGHGHDHEEGDEEAAEEPEGTPLLDMEQVRLDLELGLEAPMPGFASLNLRVGLNDYEHSEIEPSGEVATRFRNDALDARLELMHEPLAQFDGVLGLHYSTREFSAEGDEAFVPPVDTDAIGLFWVGERPLGGLDLETGVRVERVKQSPQSGRDRRFQAYGVSAGLVIPMGANWTAGVLADLSSRAPTAEELYSDGPHLATRSFEIGNPELDEETAFNLSVSLDYVRERWRLNATLYRMAFSDFIYADATGAVADELPVFRYLQQDAEFMGIDAEIAFDLWRQESNRVTLRLQGDHVTAELDQSGNDHPPRIPADRYGVGLDLDWAGLSAAVDFLRVRGQDEVAPLELATGGYDDLRLFVGMRMPAGEAELEWFLQGSNLLDDEQRNHLSFIKDFAPLPGRTLEAGLRVRF